MSACEWCWTRASSRAVMRGGSTADHYRDVIEEHERMGPLADCPQVRSAHSDPVAPALTVKSPAAKLEPES